MAANPGKTPSGKDKLSTKPLQLNHKLKPMNAESWVSFNGEFRSVIDSNALAYTFLPYTFLDINKILPKANQLTQAETLIAFTEDYDAANEYIYRNVYANIDFTVPSHGASLRALIEREYEDDRNGIGLYMHLRKTHDRRKSETGQEDIEKRLTPEALHTRISGAVSPEHLRTIAYAIHDDWLRLSSNEGNAHL